MKIEYKNLYTHFVFTTLHREPVIPKKNRERIEKFITGVVKNYNCRLYAIYANPEHIHFFVSRAPNISEEYLADIIAESSEKFINKEKLVKGSFAWQETASAFSVSKREVDKVCKYILNQKEHHRKVTFKEEYDKFIEFYEKTLQILKYGNKVLVPHYNYLY
ncbi:MAG: IS200/IS605 family transposase [Bacteroidales bacterium]|nr:IS200/IS605 family transposase [Bacteroidales bacterium]